MADDELKLMIAKLTDLVESERAENAKFRAEMRAEFRVVHIPGSMASISA